MFVVSKPNPMPESVQDRPTKAHEYIFLMSKSARYYYNAKAIAEPASEPVTHTWAERKEGGEPMRNGISNNVPALNRKSLPDTQRKLGAVRDKQRGHSRRHAGFNDRWDQMERKEQCSGTRNKRSVWEIATEGFPEAHFATFPRKLVETCLLAGTKEGDIVLDPFGGSGTTGMRAAQMGRKYILIELNPEYVKLANRTRLAQEVLL